jgi:GNAT superfamily N-acetyltransferase
MSQARHMGEFTAALYSPTQPRAPTGSAEGGQWVADVAAGQPATVATRPQEANGNGPQWRAWFREMLMSGAGPQYPRDIDSAFEFFATALPRQATLRDLYDAYTMEDPETGIRTEITHIYYSPEQNELTIWGKVHHASTASAGAFARTIDVRGDVRHDEFWVTEKLQGRGFGTKFYRQSEVAYRRMGVGAIRLIANSEVGGYAWARMGFDFDKTEKDHIWNKGSGPKGILGKAQDLWAIETGSDRIGGLPFPKQDHPWHAWEIAALTTPSGRRVGKEAMLGNAWFAVKELKPGSLGVQVGETYYAAKASKKKPT